MTEEQLNLIHKACTIGTENHRDIQLITGKLNDLESRINAIPLVKKETKDNLDITFNTVHAQPHLDFIFDYIRRMADEHGITEITYKK